MFTAHRVPVSLLKASFQFGYGGLIASAIGVSQKKGVPADSTSIYPVGAQNVRMSAGPSGGGPTSATTGVVAGSQMPNAIQAMNQRKATQATVLGNPSAGLMPAQKTLLG